MAEKKEEQKSKKVKVKILKHVMSSEGCWVPGDIAEVDEKTAEALCQEVESYMGGGEAKKIRKAMPLAEHEKLEKVPVDLKKLTQKQLRDLGKANKVPTQMNKAFEKELEAKKNMPIPGSDESKEAADKAGREVSKG